MWEMHEKAAPNRGARPSVVANKTRASSRDNPVFARRKSRPPSRTEYPTRYADGKQILQEAKRTMNLASATSHAIVDNFLERIKTYQTFQPLFAANELYARRSPAEDEGPKSTNPWEVIDNLIETSTHHLLRNRADEHFFASFGRVTGGETFRPNQRKRSHKVGFTHRDDFMDMQNGTIEKRNRTFMDIWKRDHPLHTEEELQDETCFWSSAFSEQDRATRVAYLRQLHREIDSLVSLSNGFTRQKEKEEQEQKAKIAEAQEKDDVDETDFHNLEEQQRAWIMFCKGEDCTPGFTIPEKVPHTVSDYENTEQLHEWIQHRWPHHTHRHENAAFVIQRAYRSYKAKCLTERKRYGRWQLLRAILASEEEGKKNWRAAVQEDKMRQENSIENTPESRALRLFTRKVLALVAKKRAMKKAMEAERQEIENYAATVIQKVFRGYMIRACSYLFPEVQAARLEQKRNAAAFLIQGTWKRMVAMRRWRSMRKAALVIQCCYRQHVSRRKCRHLRGLGRIQLEDQEKLYAAHTLASFGVHNLYLRDVFYRKNKEQIDLLQRVGRGYIHRAFTYNIPWQWKKEAAGAVISARWNDILAVRRARFYCGTFEKRREREMWGRIRCDAAKTIQCAWRNYLGFKQYGVRKPQPEVDNNNETSIEHEATMEECASSPHPPGPSEPTQGITSASPSPPPPPPLPPTHSGELATTQQQELMSQELTKDADLTQMVSDVHEPEESLRRNETCAPHSMSNSCHSQASEDNACKNRSKGVQFPSRLQSIVLSAMEKQNPS